MFAELMVQILRFILPHLTEVIGRGTSAQGELFLREVEPLLGEMVSMAERENITQLTPEFRAPFEVRIIALKRAVLGQS